MNNVSIKWIAQEAEAIGVQDILSWLRGLPFLPVIVEMDSLQFFNALFVDSFSPNGFGLIIGECRALAQFLGDVIFSFVRGSANSAAHFVARVGLLCQVWESGCMFHLLD